MLREVCVNIHPRKLTLSSRACAFVLLSGVRLESIKKTTHSEYSRGEKTLPRIPVVSRERSQSISYVRRQNARFIEGQRTQRVPAFVPILVVPAPHPPSRRLIVATGTVAAVRVRGWCGRRAVRSNTLRACVAPTKSRGRATNE